MASNLPGNDEKDPEKERNRLKESWESLKSREKFDDIYNFAKTNTADTIAYIVLFIGIVLWIFQYFLGGLLIGLVAGFYFGEILILWAKNLRDYVEYEGVIRSLILIGVLLGLIIAAPSIFIGAIAAIGVRYIITNINS